MSTTASESLVFTTTLGRDVTDEQLADCARLFSESYGVWGSKASQVSKYLKTGTPVKMSPSRIRSQCLGPDSALATCIVGNKLVGHAFATTWNYSEGTVGWITQLVVDPKYRQQGIATVLLYRLRRDTHTAFGLASTHPAACLALAKLGKVSMGRLDLSFIKTHTTSILETTPVEYLKSAQLRGRLFETSSNDAVVSSAFTEFYVDHNEPLEALRKYQTDHGEWPLGELLDGHEFWIVVPK